MKKLFAVFAIGFLVTACGSAPEEEPAPVNTPPITQTKSTDGLTGFERCINAGGQIIGEGTPRRCLLDARMYLEKVEK